MAGRKQLVQLALLASFGFLSLRIVMYFVSGEIGPRPPTISDNSEYSSDLSRIAFSEPEFPSFEPSRPHKLVILTYQRCGSSFFGQLFNKNPSVFYTYEPLDALYSSLYGVREGWNVPSDITTFWNGTARSIPDDELSAVTHFLDALLSCDVSNLPTESLIHRFWFLFSYFHDSLKDYTKCLRKNHLTYTRCSEYTPKLCGGRFGEKDERKLNHCKTMLSNNHVNVTDIGKEFSKNISNYQKCMSDMRIEVVSKCTDLFKKKCESAELRTAKTVRATMLSMDPLLESDPNMRIIHLIRDPRAVVLSRKNFDGSARAHYSGGDLVKEAEIYCRDVVRDVIHRQTLEKKYPQRIMTIVYDDLTKQPIAYANKIYQFLNATMHENTLTWLLANTGDKKNSTKIASKWQEHVFYLTAMQIMSKCEQFFEVVKYDFS